MPEMLEIFLFPSRIGNALHAFFFLILRLFLILLAADVLIYGPMWLSGDLEAFLRSAGG